MRIKRDDDKFIDKPAFDFILFAPMDDTEMPAEGFE